jgi:hypothetical protein
MVQSYKSGKETMVALTPEAPAAGVFLGVRGTLSA